MENEKEVAPKSKPKNAVFTLLRSFIIVCAIIFLISLKFVDYKSIYFRVRLKVLNRLRPSSISYLVKFSKKPVLSKEDDSLEKYRSYYKNVYGLMQDRIDALGLYGYCSYYLDKSDEAIDSYKKALAVNPHFFWFYHNLGAIYFKDKDYKNSIDMLTKGLATRPENVMRVIFLSQRIYLPVVKGNKDVFDEGQIMNQLKKGYRSSYMMLILSFFATEDYGRMFQSALKAIDGQLDGAGDFHFYAGVALYNLRKFEESTLFLKKSIEKNPKHAEALKYLGILSVELGSKKLGLQLIQKANYLKETGKAYVFNPQGIHLQPY